MQIPFEVDPPEKEKKPIPSYESTKLNTKISSFSEINQTVFSVSRLTKEIKRNLENEFLSLAVEGELSNFKKASSGHQYFVLKDDQSQIRCVMFRQYALSTNFQPDNGLEVIVRGNLSVYKQRGEYQIIVSSMEPKGLGALQLSFEQLKNKLEWSLMVKILVQLFQNYH